MNNQDKLTAEYFLSPEFRNDSSLMNHLATLLETSDSQGFLNVIEAELFLIITEYAKALKLMNQVRIHHGIGAGHTQNQDTLDRAAADFKKHCALQDHVSEQAENFVRFCASQLRGKP